MENSEERMFIWNMIILKKMKVFYLIKVIQYMILLKKYEEEYISNKPEVESNVESNVDVPSPISTDVKPSGVNADGQQRTAILDDGQHVKLSYGPDGTAQSIAITEEEYNTIAQNNDKALGVTTNPEGNKIVAQNIIDEEEVPVEKVRKGTVDVDGEDEVTIADPTALDSTKPKNNVANDITEKNLMKMISLVIYGKHLKKIWP